MMVTSSGRRQASRQELLRLFQSAESLFYDETLMLRASLADLDFAAFRHFVQQVYSRGAEGLLTGDEGLLRNLGLAREVDAQLVPTVACLLFFGREPGRFLPQAHVVAARIPGHDLAAAPSDAKQITGTLPAILEDSARFLAISHPGFCAGDLPRTAPRGVARDVGQRARASRLHRACAGAGLRLR